MTTHTEDTSPGQLPAVDGKTNAPKPSRKVRVIRVRQLLQEAVVDVEGTTWAEIRANAARIDEHQADWKTYEANTVNMDIDHVPGSGEALGQGHCSSGDDGVAEQQGGDEDRTIGEVAQDMVRELRCLLPGREDRFLQLCEDGARLLSENARMLPEPSQVDLTETLPAQGKMIAVVEFVAYPDDALGMDGEPGIFAVPYTGHAGTSTQVAETEVLAYVLKVAQVSDPDRYEHLVSFQRAGQSVPDCAKWCEPLHGSHPAAEADISNARTPA